MQSILKSAISPYDEMLYYETIWAIPGMTETMVTKLFTDDRVPTSIVDSLCHEQRQHFDRLFPKVENYLKTKRGFSVCVNGDFQYPLKLRDAKHPVDLFYYQGDLSLVDTPCISIVGARSASNEGKDRASRLAKELVERGYTIVSGLALGIDTAALEKALSIKGRVIGVIGTPIDETYPKPEYNNNLQKRIAANHLLISQVPFYRYRQEPFASRKHYFPRRNSTMSAISEATVIVEASEKSGTLTQARAALQQGRKLFILNSCFENPNITWPSFYEKKGAVRVKSTSDILDHLSHMKDS